MSKRARKKTRRNAVNYKSEEELSCDGGNAVGFADLPTPLLAHIAGYVNVSGITQFHRLCTCTRYVKAAGLNSLTLCAFTIPIVRSCIQMHTITTATVDLDLVSPLRLLPLALTRLSALNLKGISVTDHSNLCQLLNTFTSSLTKLELVFAHDFTRVDDFLATFPVLFPELSALTLSFNECSLPSLDHFFTKLLAGCCPVLDTLGIMSVLGNMPREALLGFITTSHHLVQHSCSQPWKLLLASFRADVDLRSLFELVAEGKLSELRLNSCSLGTRFEDAVGALEPLHPLRCTRDAVRRESQTYLLKNHNFIEFAYKRAGSGSGLDMDMNVVKYCSMYMQPSIVPQKLNALLLEPRLQKVELGQDTWTPKTLAQALLVPSELLLLRSEACYRTHARCDIREVSARLRSLKLENFTCGLQRLTLSPSLVQIELLNCRLVSFPVKAIQPHGRAFSFIGCFNKTKPMALTTCRQF
jgi:hypothetical protein